MSPLLWLALVGWLCYSGYTKWWPASLLEWQRRSAM